MKEALLLIKDLAPLLVVLLYGFALYKIGRLLHSRSERLMQQNHPKAGKPNYTKHVDWLLEREGC